MTELQKDVQVLSQTFERTVDRKDAIISSLASDLEEAEEQYQVALHSHVENIDTLIGWIPVHCHFALQHVSRL